MEVVGLEDMGIAEANLGRGAHIAAAIGLGHSREGHDVVEVDMVVGNLLDEGPIVAS
jgi:hypothetical protein